MKTTSVSDIKESFANDIKYEQCAFCSKRHIEGRYHRLNGHELGQTLGDSEGQGGLVCCSPWGHKESGTT